MPEHNPGLSPKAWDGLHRLLAGYFTKYADKLAENRRRAAVDAKNTAIPLEQTKRA